MNVPIVSLRIDGMACEIKAAFSKYILEIDGQVQEAVDQAVARFDFRAEVASQSQAILRDCIRRSLSEAFSKLYLDEGMRKALAKTLLAEVVKYGETK